MIQEEVEASVPWLELWKEETHCIKLFIQAVV